MRKIMKRAFAAVIVAAILIIKWNGPESVAERYLRG